jgi:hypothetical protein
MRGPASLDQHYRLSTRSRYTYPMVKKMGSESWERSASGFVGIPLETSRLFGKFPCEETYNIRLSGRDRFLSTLSHSGTPTELPSGHPIERPPARFPVLFDSGVQEHQINCTSTLTVRCHLPLRSFIEPRIAVSHPSLRSITDSSLI